MIVNGATVPWGVKGVLGAETSLSRKWN